MAATTATAALGATPTMAWRVSPGLTDYQEAVAAMEHRVAAIRAGEASELVWLLQHPPLYTAGTSARDSDLIAAGGLPVYRSGRGGQYTWHGPGQRVAYLMLDLGRRGRDLRRFVSDLETWIIGALATLGVVARRSPGRVGIWVPRPDKGADREDKIAAIGVRVRHWITFHGVAINVDPDLGRYAGIVPCGIRDQGVTSLADLGVKATMADLDAALRGALPPLFGPLA